MNGKTHFHSGTDLKEKEGEIQRKRKLSFPCFILETTRFRLPLLPPPLSRLNNACKLLPPSSSRSFDARVSFTLVLFFPSASSSLSLSRLSQPNFLSFFLHVFFSSRLFISISQEVARITFPLLTHGNVRRDLTPFFSSPHSGRVTLRWAFVGVFVCLVLLSFVTGKFTSLPFFSYASCVSVFSCLTFFRACDCPLIHNMIQESLFMQCVPLFSFSSLFSSFGTLSLSLFSSWQGLSHP